jgi:hypothetical protein
VQREPQKARLIKGIKFAALRRLMLSNFRLSRFNSLQASWLLTALQEETMECASSASFFIIWKMDKGDNSLAPV